MQSDALGGELSYSGLGEGARDGGNALHEGGRGRVSSEALNKMRETYEGIGAQKTVDDGLPCFPSGTEDDDKRLELNRRHSGLERLVSEDGGHRFRALYSLPCSALLRETSETICVQTTPATSDSDYGADK